MTISIAVYLIEYGEKFSLGMQAARRRTQLFQRLFPMPSTKDSIPDRNTNMPALGMAQNCIPGRWRPKWLLSPSTAIGSNGQGNIGDCSCHTTTNEIFTIQGCDSILQAICPWSILSPELRSRRPLNMCTCHTLHDEQWQVSPEDELDAV